MIGYVTNIWKIKIIAFGQPAQGFLYDYLVGAFQCMDIKITTEL